MTAVPLVELQHVGQGHQAVIGMVELPPVILVGHGAQQRDPAGVQSLEQLE